MVVPRWYTSRIASRYRRIQVTEDPELAEALRAAAPHLPANLPRSRQIRDLAIAGAQHLSGAPLDEGHRRELLEQLADHFRKPETAPWDWDYLRESKRHAWPLR